MIRANTKNPFTAKNSFHISEGSFFACSRTNLSILLRTRILASEEFWSRTIAFKREAA
jgi:hypothetical protein